MFTASVEGLFLVFQWPAIGFLILGVLIGIWLGAVPGLGGVIGLILLMPFTFDMDPVPAIALLLGMYSVTTTSDTIASVLLGIPGTAASQATVLDGHPLPKKGHAARAFGAAFTVSAFGGVFGALILAASLPLIMPIILAFSKAELFMLGALGLTMVGSLTGRSVVKGLTVVCLGLLMATVGYGETMPIPRFYFGFDYLLDGLPLLPVVLGLFGIPEVMELAVRNSSISNVSKEQAVGGGLMDVVRDALRNWWLAVRCSIIGTYVGMLPGLGPAIVDWIAYGHAVQSAKDTSQFGKGDIRGVIAPEAANNAIKGGALVPTVAFGIPGSLGAAILLGALLIQGIQPGPSMLTTKLDFTFSLVWTIVIANIVAAAMLMIWVKQVAKLAFIPGHLIVPGVVGFVLMGAWLSTTAPGDWIAVIVMGLVGFVMKRGGWPRPPLVLAIILGGIMEQTFHISMRAHAGPSWLWERPVVVGIAVVCVLTVILSIRSNLRLRKADSHSAAGEGNERNPIVSLPFAVILLALFGYAVIESQTWSSSPRLFPFAIAVPALVMTLIIVIGDTRALAVDLRTKGPPGRIWADFSDTHDIRKILAFFVYLIGVLLLTLLIGQKLALPIFVAVYLLRWGKYSFGLAAIYALSTYVVLIVFYDRVLNLFWHRSWLREWLPAYLPDWLPSWLLI